MDDFLKQEELIKKEQEKKQKIENLKKNFSLIDSYFKKKEKLIEQYKHIPIEEILNNSPKYYSIIRILEQINSFLTKDNLWLKKLITKYNVNFNWQEYEKWKAGVDYYKYNYDETYSPSKWIHLVQDKLIEILKEIQVLLYIECYIDEDDFKKFLKKHPEIDYKIKANFMKKSLPSEDLNIFFDVIDHLLKINIDNDLSAKLIIDTKICMQAYRKIDNSQIFDLLKRKEFYIKYRLEYLVLTKNDKREKLPMEEEIIEIAGKFLEDIKDINFIYNEYKERLIEKYNKIKAKL